MKNKLSSQALTELDATIQNIEDEDTKLFFQRTKTLKIATDLSDKRNKLIHNINYSTKYTIININTIYSSYIIR